MAADSSNGRTVKVGLIQMACTPEVPENRAKAAELAREAAGKGAQIICFQELFVSQYFCQTEDSSRFDLAEEIPGPTTNEFCALAKELGTVLILPVFEKRAPGIYHNSACVVDADGTLLGVYRKMHIPDDPQYYEKYYFTPGDLGFKSFDTKFGKVGVCICWDQWYPEAARLTAMSGAEIIFYPTAIGWLPHDQDAGIDQAQHSAWETMQRSHAIANGCFIAAPNRIGVEDGENGQKIQFWGQSFVTDPAGVILGKAEADSEGVLVVEVDFSKIAQQRVDWPFFRDRRIDAYGGIGNRFGNP